MFPGPVFQYELLTLARRRRYYGLRLAYGLLLLWIVWLIYPGGSRTNFSGDDSRLSIQESSETGRAVFSSIATAQSIAVLVLTPALVAGVIADEKQRKTLHYLLSSDLGSGEIVVGKLASRLLSIGVYLFLALPVLSIVSFLGGIDPNDVLLLYLASGSTAFLIGSYAIVVSVHARRPREAVTSVYVAELAWLFGPSVVMGVLSSFRSRLGPLGDLISAACRAVGSTSPVFLILDPSMFWRGPGKWYELVLWMVGFQILTGTALLAFAVWRLRPVFRAQGSTGKGFAPLRFLSGRRLLPRPACGDDPLLWKELFFSRRRPVARVVGALLALLVLGLIGYWTAVFCADAAKEILQQGYWASVNNNAHNDLNAFVRGVATFLLVCGELGAAAVAAGALTSEREEDTWISLIATPMPPRQIVRAKLLGSLWATRYLAALWLALVTIGLVLGAVHPFGFAGGVVVAGVYLVFCAALGLTFSLRCRTSTRALCWAIGTLILCNGVYLLICIPFDHRPTTFPFLGVTPFIGVASIMSYRDVEQLNRELTGLGVGNIDDICVTAIASVILYAVVAIAMILVLVTDFDDVIDRPRTSGVPKRRKARPFDSDFDAATLVNAAKGAGKE
jgi:ABC-type transport system involved in multi-copper enzyme maturation permease subunit